MKQNDEDLFNNLKELGRKIVTSDDKISGTKFIVFFRGGEIFEYNSKMDEELRNGGR